METLDYITEWFIYVFEAFMSALRKSATFVGLGLTFVISLVSWAISPIFNLKIDDIGQGLILVCVAFVFVLVTRFTWEIQAYFPDIVVNKRNTSEGAEIVIFNNEAVYFTNLEVEIYKKTWISKLSRGIVPSMPDPSNRLFDIGTDTSVSYGGGIKTVLIGSGKNETATFHYKMQELSSRSK